MSLTTFLILVNAARRLEKEKDNNLGLQWIFCGTGSRLIEFQKKAKDLTTVFFPGWIKKIQIQSLMQMSQIGIAPYAANTKMSLPNKPFEYMAGGLTILSSIQNELPDILQNYACGLNYIADDENDLFEKVTYLKNNPKELLKMKTNSRKLFLEHRSADSPI